MCQIVYQKGGKKLTYADLKLAVTNNSDGLGYMFVADGRVQVHREVGLDYDHIEAIIDAFGKMPVAYHLRWATRGKVTVDNVHPFRICHKDRDGLDLFVMHNGTFNGMGSDAMSDTVEFNNMYLKPLLQANPWILHNEAFRKNLELICDGNKLLFMDSEGAVTTIGVFTKRSGVQVANLYSFDDWHRTSYDTCDQCLLKWHLCDCYTAKVAGYKVEDAAKAVNKQLANGEEYERVNMISLEQMLIAMSVSEIYLWVMDNPKKCREWFSAIGDSGTWEQFKDDPDKLCDLVCEDLGKISLRSQTLEEWQTQHAS